MIPIKLFCMNALYHPLVENPHSDRAKAPGLNDRKSPHISNIGRLTIVKPREVSRDQHGEFQGEDGIETQGRKNNLQECF